MMLQAAYQATKNKEYLRLQRKAFDWFLGSNDLHIPVYNFTTHGCHDGLTPNGLNLNQGAESTLSFLLALLTVVESYATVEKSDETKKLAAGVDRKAKAVEPTAIKEMAPSAPKNKQTNKLV